MGRLLKFTLLITALTVIALGTVSLVLQYASEGSPNFDYSGAQITPDVIKLHCRFYGEIKGARILRVRNDEGMTGGEFTIKFELPANQLAGFLDSSPFKGARLESKFVPGRFLGDSWLSVSRFNELESSKAFSAASLSMGRTAYTILIDHYRPDRYVIYFNSAS